MNIELSDHEAQVIRAALGGAILLVLDTKTGPHSAVTAVVAEMTDLLVRLDG